MNLFSLAKGCAECRACEDAAYQTPPVLYAGYTSAPILAIGQNPGEIKPSDKARQDWMDIFVHMPDEDLCDIMPAFYLWDFYSSPGYKRLCNVFGDDWLLKGEMIWTNAIRCRTPGNAQPSDEMLETCKTWTNQLMEGRKAIIMVGGVARQQVLGEDSVKLEWGAPKKHPTLGYILAIKHYAARGWRDDIKMYKQAVDKLKERVL